MNRVHKLTATRVKEMCYEHCGAVWPPQPSNINSLTVAEGVDKPSRWEMMQSCHQSDGAFRLRTGTETHGHETWSDSVKRCIVENKYEFSKFIFGFYDLNKFYLNSITLKL